MSLAYAQADLLFLATNGNSGEPAWSTAVVASAAAVLGAVVGGLATYAASVRLENRRRRARAAVRRKAKVYTPLRAELLALREAMECDEHLEWGISRKQPDHKMGPSFYRWSQLVADGRASTASSVRVRTRIEAVEDAIEDFNSQRATAVTVFSAQARPIYADVMSKELTQAHWPDTGEVAEVVRDAARVWGLFGFSTVEQETNQECSATFQASFNALEDVQNTRAGLMKREVGLKATIAVAVDELEAAMQRIAAKYEKEEPND